jgi:hypothetical protein
MILAVALDYHLQQRREGINRGRTHTVQAPRGLVRGFFKLAARMELGKDDFQRRYARCVHIHRNAASAVDHGNRFVTKSKLACHLPVLIGGGAVEEPNCFAISGNRFVNRVV